MVGSAEMVPDELIGVTTEQAAHVTGSTVRQLAAWQRSGLVVPHRSVQVGQRTVRVYRLNDLVEISIVKELEARGCTLRQIRRLVDAYESVDTPRPLRHLVWATDAGKIYVQFPDGSWFGGRVPNQGVISEVLDLERIRATVRERALTRPGEPGQIERRDRTMGRKMVFAGTRTPVDAVHAYMRRGIPDREILEAFPHLDVADLDAARELLSA